MTTTCSADGFEMVRSLGADDVIDYKKESLVSAMEGKERYIKRYILGKLFEMPSLQYCILAMA